VSSPRGASIVTHWCVVSSTGSLPHQLGVPRPVERQYANCSTDGAWCDHHGSSSPFHTPIALAPGSAFSEPTTFASSVSVVEPGVARETVLRLTHVARPFAAAARSCSFASSTSVCVHALRCRGAGIGALREHDREHLLAVQDERPGGI